MSGEVGHDDAARPATAGAEPPRLVDPDEEAAAVEVLIAEARARARRRRRWYALAILAALIGAMVVVSSGRADAPADRLPMDAPAPPRPAVPAALDPARIVASDGVYHLGWVIVYGDGRVIVGHETEPLERRLTAAGLDLVRSGAIAPMDLLFPSSSLPEDIWADSTIRPYQPTRYAACPDGPGTAPAPARAPLPAAAQALLRGREHTYTNVDVVSRPADSGPSPVAECSELSADEAALLVDILHDAGFSYFEQLRTTIMTCGGLGPSKDVSICVNAVLPHGSWVLWGG